MNIFTPLRNRSSLSKPIWMQRKAMSALSSPKSTKRNSVPAKGLLLPWNAQKMPELAKWLIQEPSVSVIHLTCSRRTTKSLLINKHSTAANITAKSFSWSSPAFQSKKSQAPGNKEYRPTLWQHRSRRLTGVCSRPSSQKSQVAACYAKIYDCSKRSTCARVWSEDKGLRASSNRNKKTVCCRAVKPSSCKSPNTEITSLRLRSSHGIKSWTFCANSSELKRKSKTSFQNTTRPHSKSSLI